MTTTGGILGRDARLETAGATTISYPPYSPLGYAPFGLRKGSVWTNSGTMRFDDNLAPWGGFDTVPGAGAEARNAAGGILEVIDRDQPYVHTELVNDGTIRGTGTNFQLRYTGGGSGSGVWGGIAGGGTFELGDGARLQDLVISGAHHRAQARGDGDGRVHAAHVLRDARWPRDPRGGRAVTLNGGNLGVNGGRVLVPPARR